ncbi:MAG TPA: preprotein translocase subunit YajC [Chitinophagales bacterium]|nr:preprotein translocase subunit YajC [Chitinophagales bacterium]
MNNLFFLQAAAGGSSYMPLVFMVGMFAVMYFFMIRPQQKKAKEQKAWVDELKKGDKVVTMSGLHGLISQVSAENPVVIVEIAINTHVKMDKSAISLDMSKAAYPTA